MTEFIPKPNPNYKRIGITYINDANKNNFIKLFTERYPGYDLHQVQESEGLVLVDVPPELQYEVVKLSKEALIHPVIMMGGTSNAQTY